jgi:hypothetical protein
MKIYNIDYPDCTRNEIKETLGEYWVSIDKFIDKFKTLLKKDDDLIKEFFWLNQYYKIRNQEFTFSVEEAFTSWGKKHKIVILKVTAEALPYNESKTVTKKVVVDGEEYTKTTKEEIPSNWITINKELPFDIYELNVND